MSIPDLTPTDLTKNIIGILIVAVYLLLTVQQLEIPTELDLAFWAVLALYGISVAKPAVNSVLKAYGKSPSPNLAPKEDRPV